MAEPQATLRPSHQSKSLWRDAPGWRLTAITAILLTISSAGVFWLDADHEAWQSPTKQVQTGPLPDARPAAVAPAQAKLEPQAPSLSASAKPQSAQTASARPISRTKPNAQAPADAPPTEVDKATAMQTQAAATSGACSIVLPFQSRRYATGVVISAIPSGQALSSVARDEAMVHGRIDPAYIDSPHVRVATSDGHPDVIVPKGMKVSIGDRVGMQDGHRSSAVPCGWIPNIIVDDFGPVPATPSSGQ